MARCRRRDEAGVEAPKRVIKSSAKKRGETRARKEKVRLLLHRYEPIIERRFSEMLERREELAISAEVVESVNALLVDFLERMLASVVKTCHDQERRVLGAAEFRQALDCTVGGQLKEACEKRGNFALNIVKGVIEAESSSAQATPLSSD